MVTSLVLAFLLLRSASLEDPQCRPLNQYWEEIEPILQAMTLD